MHEVEVTSVVQPSARALREQLSPQSILEYAEIYDIHTAERTAAGTEVTASLEDNELTVVFTELENGYEYTFVDGAGMFEQRYSKLIVESGDETRVSAVARYSFDSVWSFVLDRLAAGTVTKELETTIANLVEETIDAGSEPTSSGK
ncbi:hypothetical protein [Natronorubrum bangense]|uniref:Polyketide cyclase/dehydrase n=2 Tax=Natronorubrum bangense TaxID=61858 RepID=L9WR13_9EURY|nr:hypothetical protein [Natronorubrum bangense]ELY51924.1 hypothetical protein C494_02286 [Natronorubrum bangense JCM 10635]QCC54851.1 hypothetical protein DV706_10475 [Natronorubrum bangense]